MYETTKATHLIRPESRHRTEPTSQLANSHRCRCSDNHVYAADRCTAFCGLCGNDCIYELGHMADHRCSNGHTW